MELNMKVLVKVAMMLLLLGVTATVEGRFDARSFMKEVLPSTDANHFVKSTTAIGVCTLTWPIYYCNYPGEECHPPCSDLCICEINGITGTRKCGCGLDTKFFTVAGAHEVQ